MGISSAGLGSGLDVNGIVTSLMGIEQKPLTAVTKQKTSYQSQISAYGTLKSGLSTFQTAVSALSSASKFNAQNVTSGNASVFTATSNGSATLGDYAVTVSQLAKSQKLSFAGTANIADTVGTGTLTISFGTYNPLTATAPITPNSFTPNAAKTDISITIDSTNNTLAGVRDAINAANSSVSATIVNDGTANYLVITSKDTGEVNSLKISVADTDGDDTNAAGLSQLAYDPTASAGSGKNMTQMQAAKNAILDIDGIAVVKASNTISDAISGVTLNLLATSAGVSANLGVASNKDKVKESVTAFIDAYNKLDSSLRSLTKYDESGKNSGVLLGDATTRSVISQLKAVMTKTVSSGGALTSLSQIGVSFQRDGKLALDATKLDAAVATNFGDIASLFATTAKVSDPQVSFVSSTKKTQSGIYAINVTGLAPTAGTINGVAANGTGSNLLGAAGDASEGLNIKVTSGALGARGTVNFSIGYAAQLDSVITNLLGETGILASRTDGINTSIKRLDKQAESITARLTSIEARYRAQFTRLDTLMSSMSTTSSFLTQQIASINANSK
ncbi:MAG: flagellar filament capping protein FliD [Methylotenera sp.]|uniref:flagellar filament capping protein FliD n=1 Tax=Methylotenera sp. TaxID=2051956 RepID=UPI002730A0B3|nr:flagellar filament capping protein FliD [Methylotenera sp.]MDP1522525.1 flagellar filament capping protein FliD [Methylotenera sp.]